MDLGALTSGFLTGLREGVEAALIVAIVLAYLVRTGNSGQVGKVWLGAGAAAAVSLVAGIAIFVTVGSLRAPYEQYFEGGAMLVAATVVTWMLFWMRRQSMGLRGVLQAQIDRVLAGDTAVGLVIVVFTAVIREGIETALFLVGQATSAATAAATGASSVLFGAVLGLLAAVAIGWVFYTGSRRIDLRRFFLWTGIALVFIAAGLLANAVHEFIEVGAIGIGTAIAFDISSILSHETGVGEFLHAILGYSSRPEVAALGVQVAYLVIVLGLYLRPGPPVPPRPATAAALPDGAGTGGVIPG